MEQMGHMLGLIVSLPVRGAWIEIWEHVPRIYAESGRSPCGERGLKFGNMCRESTLNPSLPVRGAWIEITKRPTTKNEQGSLPVRGAWIEIVGGIAYYVMSNVAPRAGSVD